MSNNRNIRCSPGERKETGKRARHIERTKERDTHIRNRKREREERWRRKVERVERERRDGYPGSNFGWVSGWLVGTDRPRQHNPLTSASISPEWRAANLRENVRQTFLIVTVAMSGNQSNQNIRSEQEGKGGWREGVGEQKTSISVLLQQWKQNLKPSPPTGS